MTERELGTNFTAEVIITAAGFNPFLGYQKWSNVACLIAKTDPDNVINLSIAFQRVNCVKHGFQEMEEKADLL